MSPSSDVTANAILTSPQKSMEDSGACSLTSVYWTSLTSGIPPGFLKASSRWQCSSILIGFVSLVTNRWLWQFCQPLDHDIT